MKIGNKRGQVMFVGKAVIIGPGYWVGLKMDDPVGHCDGLGFFECPQGYGSFVRPNDIEIGD